MVVVQILMDNLEQTLKNLKFKRCHAKSNLNKLLVAASILSQSLKRLVSFTPGVLISKDSLVWAILKIDLSLHLLVVFMESKILWCLWTVQLLMLKII